MRPHVVHTHHDEALHLLRHAAPHQKGCNAYGSGAAHENTRQNVDSAQQRGLARQRADAPNCTSTPGPTGAEGTGRGSTELLLTRALPHPTCAHAKPLCGLMMPISGVMLPAEGSSHQARGATNIAHSTQKHGDDETNNTTAHHQHGTVETNDTSAPKTAPKTPISRPQRRWRFQTTGPPRLQPQDAALVGSDNPSASQISHVIYPGHFSRCPKTLQFQQCKFNVSMSHR